MPGNLLLSWTIPTKSFVVQQNSTFNPQDWIDLPVQPVLNVTNLRNQISILAPLGPKYFRLTSR
jgi:hypothetical protein